MNQVTLYSEALCPDCRYTYKSVILPLWKNGLLKLVDFTMVPSGFAVLDERGELACQHGAPECSLNLILDCAIEVADSMDQWIPYVGCVEEHADNYSWTSKFVQTCATEVRYAVARIRVQIC